MRQMLYTFVLLFASLISHSALAQWSLDNDASILNFVTTKAEHVAEVHTFDQLRGSLSSNGDLEITIALASVNTLIPIRNERMQAMLFDIGVFPEGQVSAQLPMAELASLSEGQSKQMTVDFDLTLRGMSETYSADLQVIRTEAGLIASTRKPIIVQGSAHDLLEGIEALREVAGLPSIGRAVPVSFTVVFE